MPPDRFKKNSCLGIISIIAVSLILIIPVSADLSTLSVSPSLPGTPYNKIILISLDGVQVHHFTQLLILGKLPHLQKLIGQGGVQKLYITDHTTDTARWPRQHVYGVWSGRNRC